MSTTTPTPAAETTQPPGDQPSDPVGACCGRRAVLRAAGLVALSGGAVGLAACGADSTSTAPSVAATSAEPSAAESAGESAAEASPSTSADSAPPETSEAPPEGTAVAISGVAVGGGVVVDQKYVVTQPTSGEFKAFSAICTHQGCPVGSVQDGQIVCPCHNSHFDISTGDPTSGPAQEPLPAMKVTKSGDNVYVS